MASPRQEFVSYRVATTVHCAQLHFPIWMRAGARITELSVGIIMRQWKIAASLAVVGALAAPFAFGFL
jgi:hypothetical protein